MKNKIVLYIFALLFLFLFAIILHGFSNYLSDDKDFCLDTGICAEGLTLNTKTGKIKINKQTCAKSGGKWLEDKKACAY